MVDTVETSKVTLIDDKTASIVDSTGRNIRIRRLSALDRMMLYSAAGSENAENSRVMGYAFLASSVIDIDGTTHARPNNFSEIEMMVERLDEPGMEAIAKAAVAMNSKQKDVAKAAQNL